MAGGTAYDAVVVGSGPNGLVAAVTMARAGRRVVVFEQSSTPGGGCRTAELTEAGFRHDVCSAVHPLGIGSPALRELPLEAHGVRWIHPAVPLAHPLADGAALLHRSLDATAAGLGADGEAWRRLVGPLVAGGSPAVSDDLLSPLSFPQHPLKLARFASVGVRGAEQLARRRLATDPGQALLAGLAAHSVLALDRPLVAGVGLELAALAHLVGWPVAEGGSQAIADALVAILREAGGEVVCDAPITELSALPPTAVVLADVAPAALVRMAGDRFPARARRRWSRFRHGPGTFKLDYALSGPVPWTDPLVAGAGTVHIGGTMTEVARAERAVADGQHPHQPFVIAAQPTSCDPTRAPAGLHTLWAYCHVPAGSDVDMTAAVEDQIERFAPGFRDLVIARHATTSSALAAYNPNCVGGDITGGVLDWRQFVNRPVLARRPWRTPVDGVYLCSASTPPGGGVHGMCGLHAARLALRDHPG
ncbi:MAG: NAD(P)/FAD-dependent oxidoreductase [Ilumatobacteraceae bacterium]